MRHTSGSAASAAWRVASSVAEAAIASAKIAGVVLGRAAVTADRDDLARRARAPSLSTQRHTAVAFSRVSVSSAA